MSKLAHSNDATLFAIEAAARGWTDARVLPVRPGVYVRLTFAFGVTHDLWDGTVWRRTVAKTGLPRQRVPGVQCANQRWPWKAA